MTSQPEPTPPIVDDVAQADDRGQIRPFADFLQDQRNGRAHTEASDALHELIDAVVEHQKPGTLTLKIVVSPADSGDAEILKVVDDVLVKLPRADRSGSYFFATAGRNLSRDDTRQRRLPLREVPDGAEPLRQV
jgi:hypothetical protein